MNIKPEILPDAECNAIRPPDTETIDRLFLELSQFSNARTGREMKLKERIIQLECQLSEATSKSSFSRGYEQGKRDAAGVTPPIVISEQTLMEHKAALRRAVEHSQHLEKVICELKDERDDNEAKIKDLKFQLQNASRQRDESGAEARQKREDCEKACELVAKMHAAAMGRICGPARGVVEDVEDLRKERDALRCKLNTAEKEAQRQYQECCFQAQRADGNYLSLTAAKKELDDLKANNRYQRGHTDGYQEAMDKVKERFLKLMD